MINYGGTVDVTWTVQDYVNLKAWRTYHDFYPYYVDSDVPNPESYNTGVLACSEGLPESLLCVANHFPDIDNIIVAVNRMVPGKVLPFHSDKYVTYKKNHGLDDTAHIMRVMVYLHDPEPGQQLWIDDSFCLGKAGSYFWWRDDTVHMAANLSKTDRYVMQITGTIS